MKDGMEPHGAFGCVGAHNHVFVVVLLPSVDELSTPEREREEDTHCEGCKFDTLGKNRRSRVLSKVYFSLAKDDLPFSCECVYVYGWCRVLVTFVISITS